MTNFPVYTLDHVRAALDLTDEQADKVRDYVPPPPVSPELQLARECAAEALRGKFMDAFANLVESGTVDADLVYGVPQALLALQRRDELDTPVEPQADDDGWIAWSGDVRPTFRGVRVSVRYRDGTISGPRPADWWSWHHSGLSSDIIAYKPEPGK